LDRELFLGCDLGGADELLIRGNAQSLMKAIGENEKREFIMVINSRN
jgi:16S rRNA C1402 (ribose-2'-O) methylase RsmI